MAKDEANQEKEIKLVTFLPFLRDYIEIIENKIVVEDK